MGSYTTLPGSLIVSGNTVYYIAKDLRLGMEVYATSGTQSVQLDPNPQSSTDTYSAPAYLTPFTQAAGTSAATGTPALAFVGLGIDNLYHVFVTTGTNGTGTTSVGSFIKSPSNFVVSGNTVYFTAADTTNANMANGVTQVWATTSDGKTVQLDTTGQIDSYNVVANSLTPFTEANGTSAVAFVGYVASDGLYHVFVTNGAANTGTISVGTSKILPGNLVVSGNAVYYTASPDTSSHTEVYSTTGTTQSVRLDPNTNSQTNAYAAPYALTPFTEANGTNAVAFVGSVANNNITQYQVFVTNGTPNSGTFAVGSPFVNPPSSVVVNGSTVYFTDTNSNNVTEVYASTPDGKIIILDPATTTYTGATLATTPTYAITAANAGAVLATSGTTPFTFTVSDSNVTGTSILNYTVAGSGTNSAPSSAFSATSGTVTLSSGVSSQTITVNVLAACRS